MAWKDGWQSWQAAVEWRGEGRGAHLSSKTHKLIPNQVVFTTLEGNPHCDAFVDCCHQEVQNGLKKKKKKKVLTNRFNMFHHLTSRYYYLIFLESCSKGKSKYQMKGNSWGQGRKKKWGYSHPPPFGSRRVFGAWSWMVDGWSGIPGLEVVVVVAIKDVDVAFTEVPSVVVRGVGDRNEEAVGKETGIGLWVITGFAVEKMMANPARLRARRRLKENCIIFFLCKKKKK